MNDGAAGVGIIGAIWIGIVIIKDIIWLFGSFWRRLFIVIFMLVSGFLIAGAVAGILGAIIGGRMPPPELIIGIGTITWNLWHRFCRKVIFRRHFD